MTIEIKRKDSNKSEIHNNVENFYFEDSKCWNIVYNNGTTWIFNDVNELFNIRRLN